MPVTIDVDQVAEPRHAEIESHVERESSTRSPPPRLTPPPDDADELLVLVELEARCSTPIPDAYKKVIADFEGADLELAVPS